MMKRVKFLMIALVAMLGFTACEKDCGHDFIEVDYSRALVGTWTLVNGDFAEAWVVKEDGSVEVTGVLEGEYYETKGTVKVKNNKMSYKFDNGDEFEGIFDIIPGQCFSISFAWDYESDERVVYQYCANDLSDEIIGMWVCNDAPAGADNDMAIISYANDGSTTFTGILPNKDGYMLNVNTTYNVVGDLMFKKNAVQGTSDSPNYISTRLTYAPNGTGAGDIMVYKHYNGTVETSSSYLRIKQELNLTNNLYAYSSAYVSNAKGADENFTMLGHTFNMANIKAGDFDMIFRSELYCVGLNANSIKHKFRPNGQDVEVETPITVEGNKVTLDMSAINPACRKVEMYMFQDADDTQLHMYMPTSSFVNYFANLGIPDLIAEGKLDPTDAAAVAKVYAEMEARVESINVSFVMKAIEPVE